MSNYPVGFDGIEGREEELHLFEIHGELAVEAFSEEDAEELLMDNLIEYITTAIQNGELEIN